MTSIVGQSRRQTLRGFWLNHEPLFLGLLGVLAVIGLWELATRTGIVDPFLASSPTLTAKAFVQQLQTGTLIADVLATVKTLGLGFVIAVLLGLPAGFLSATYRVLEQAVDPFVAFFDSMPKLALYPLLIIWLGFGTLTIITLAVMMAIVPIYTAGFSGLRGVQPEFVAAARSFGAGPVAVFAKVALPASVPVLIAGARIGIDRAITGVMVGEIFGGDEGLGFRMTYLALQLRTDEYFAPIVALIIVGLGMTQALHYAEGRVSRWRQKVT